MRLESAELPRRGVARVWPRRTRQGLGTMSASPESLDLRLSHPLADTWPLSPAAAAGSGATSGTAGTGVG